MPKIMWTHMGAEVEMKMNVEGGQAGDRSTGEVIVITKKTGGHQVDNAL